jgi:valyl-tRNA synthetase
LVYDEAVDKSFGSGAVKVTPAHDPTDFEIAERRKLPHLTVIGFDGKMTQAAGQEFAGLDRFEARKKVVADLEALGLLDGVEDYNVAAAVCYRCETVIEPLESEQWFLSMANMAKRAKEATKKGKVRIVPKSWESPYQLWLTNLRDWCVSRQIWWGHRIPVWYCMKKKSDKLERSSCPPIVSMTDPTSCPKCKGAQLEQDPDVLDTWFSSALWPFSVFAWPETTPDLKRYFPTTTLVTGHEILYLWVARMVMFSLEFMGKVPYSTVLIHGIVRDKKGRKMSKSLGNVIDPLDLVAEFGADAVRFSLAQSAAPGRDMQISKENFVATRNFNNKIWNATRFAMMHIGDLGASIPSVPSKNNLELSDRWILQRLSVAISETTDALERHDIDAASRGLYDFFWSELCDWYLEMIKPRLDRQHYADVPVTPESQMAARTVLATVLEAALRLLHPFIPFITEELWEKVPKPSQTTAKHVMVTSWPEAPNAWTDAHALKEMNLLQEIVTKLRTIRSEMGIPPSQPIQVLARCDRPESEKILRSQAAILKCLNSRVGSLTMGLDVQRPKASAAAVVPGAVLYVPLEGLIDFSKERGRLEKEMSAISDDAQRLMKKLSNQDFVSNAPSEEVEKTKSRLNESQERLKRLQDNIATLQ